MIFVDRVYCDFCGMPMGQLMSQPADAPDLLSDKSEAPHYCVCPDCDCSTDFAREVAA